MRDAVQRVHVGVDVRFRIVAGEMVLVSQRAGEVLGLNASATRIVELVAALQHSGTALVSDVIAQLVAEFDGEADVIAADVRSLIANLCDLGALQAVDAAGAQPA